MIEKLKLYYTTTFLYSLIGVIGAVFMIISIMTKNYLLFIMTILVIYVSYDNVHCESRKEKYLKK